MGNGRIAWDPRERSRDAQKQASVIWDEDLPELVQDLDISFGSMGSIMTKAIYFMSAPCKLANKCYWTKWTLQSAACCRIMSHFGSCGSYSELTLKLSDAIPHSSRFVCGAIVGVTACEAVVGVEGGRYYYRIIIVKRAAESVAANAVRPLPNSLHRVSHSMQRKARKRERRRPFAVEA